MTIHDMYDLVIHLMRKQLKENPGKTYKNKNGERVTLDEVIQQFTLLSNWVYPSFTTDDVSKIVRCKKCKHYKKYKKKGVIKARVIHACELDKKPRDPEFFCGDGDEGLYDILE